MSLKSKTNKKARNLENIIIIAIRTNNSRRKTNNKGETQLQPVF